MDIKARTEQGTTFKKRRRCITVNAYLSGATAVDPPSVRGKCTGWNDGVMNRAGNYVENFRQDFKVFGTLTYPATFPGTGTAIKRNWHAFIERLRRDDWLKTGSIFWWIEFQERGAPHFHFLATEFIGMHRVAAAWAEITQGDIQACSRVESIRKPDAIGNYMKKYMQKAEQKAIPDGFVDIGRMWGCSGPKFWRQMRRLPVVVASTNQGLPRSFFDILVQARCRFRVRLTSTQSGYVIHGTEQDITDTWLYLAAHIARIDLAVQESERLRRMIAVVLRSTPEKQENNVMQ